MDSIELYRAATGQLGLLARLPNTHYIFDCGFNILRVDLLLLGYEERTTSEKNIIHYVYVLRLFSVTVYTDFNFLLFGINAMYFVYAHHEAGYFIDLVLVLKRISNRRLISRWIGGRTSQLFVRMVVSESSFLFHWLI